MRRFTVTGFAFGLLLTTCLPIRHALAQGGYNDDRVMIQGFEWNPPNQHDWYKLVRSKADELRDAKIDLIWLPPPGHAPGMGYYPEDLYNFDNSFGTDAQHHDLLKALLQDGVEPIADVVINHRNGTSSWAHFTNPDWPSSFICSDDEFWSKDSNDGSLSPIDRTLLIAGKKGGSDTGDHEGGCRDLDHTNGDLRKAVKEYLQKLKSFGYRGWRYDEVKGFSPEYVAEYNFDSQPSFAVGEYREQTKPLDVAWWVDGTKQWGQPDPAVHACSAFDFPTFDRLKDLINNGKYADLRAISFQDGQSDGLIAINKDKAVTFIENHDTGKPHESFNSFDDNSKLLQAYAFILTHPGVPCIYWEHYFDWHHEDALKRLILARKYAGVHSGSYIKTELQGGDYVAVVGDKPEESSTLIVKIGPGTDFKPDASVWHLETFGDGYAVWVRSSKKEETKPHVDAVKPGFPVP